MDSYEATKIVFSRIQALDPDNASKITGYVLLQEHGEKEMIRLAFGPENLLLGLIQRAKSYFLNSSSTRGTSSSSFTPAVAIPRPSALSLSSPLCSPRVPSSPSPWSVPVLSPRSSPSYAAVLNGNNNFSSPPVSYPTTAPVGSDDLADDFKFLDHLYSINESSPKGLDLYRQNGISEPNWLGSIEPENPNHHGHRRSFSLSDACIGSSEESGLHASWKPCLFYARGFCKNGSSCKFLHGGFAEGTMSSPAKLDGFDHFPELLRSKSVLQKQRLTTAPTAMNGFSFPCMNYFMEESQRSALAMADEIQKFNRSRLERNDFSASPMNGSLSPGSRQIYLTFPADSTFREEDVSNYFSSFGPVQDVRIPYQQKRMFGFVTFVYPETVKMILAKGNPHFVCDSRVLVKPYKEKGKMTTSTEKKQQLQYSPSSPTAIELHDLGGRVVYSTQDLVLRRRMEEQQGNAATLDVVLRRRMEEHVNLQLQGRRMMNLQLLDLKNFSRLHPQSPRVPSPILTPQAEAKQQRRYEEFDLDQILPENLFSSPKKCSAAEQRSVFAIGGSSGIDEEKTGLSNTNSPCAFQLPRFSSGAIEM